MSHVAWIIGQNNAHRDRLRIDYLWWRSQNKLQKMHQKLLYHSSNIGSLNRSLDILALNGVADLVCEIDIS